jgi:hypothetical protein
MTVLQVLTNEANTVANTPQALFTAGTEGVVIDSFTATNTSSVNASYKAYIVSTAVEKPQIPFEIVVWGEINLGIGILGQLIPAGAELRLESSAIDSIYFTATGHTV